VIAPGTVGPASAALDDYECSGMGTVTGRTGALADAYTSWLAVPGGARVSHAADDMPGSCNLSGSDLVEGVSCNRAPWRELMRRTATALGIAGLAVATLLTGCGTNTGTSAAPPGDATGISSSAGTDLDAAAVKAENMIADCMKKKGFQYTPHPLRFGAESQVDRYAGGLSVLEPADQVRAFRSKYGFGGYSKQVYPNDAALRPAASASGKNPNNAIRAALGPAQQKAYDRAFAGNSGEAETGQGAPNGDDVGCAGEASAKYFGTQTDESRAASRRAYAQFENDPAVIEAAQKYAGCLKDRGYTVASTRPGKIEYELRSQFAGNGGAAKAAGSADDPAGQGQAKEGLRKEIKAALDDLDCRTGYAELARTKYAAAVRSGGGVG